MAREARSAWFATRSPSHGLAQPATDSRSRHYKNYEHPPNPKRHALRLHSERGTNLMSGVRSIPPPRIHGPETLNQKHTQCDTPSANSGQYSQTLASAAQRHLVGIPPTLTALAQAIDEVESAHTAPNP
jgi:hypothetical protein